MTDARREQLLRRIRALQLRTVENGCTEAEAMAAIALAASLADRYSFSLSDLEAKAEAVTEEAEFATGRKLRRMVLCVQAIAKYCDCEVYQMPQRDGTTKLVFFGRASDTAIARYFTHLVANALRSGWHEYIVANRDDRAVTPRKLRKSFELGMAIRIVTRLDEMKAARNAHVDPESGRSGQELVVVANALVKDAYAKRYAELGLKPGRRVWRTPVSGHAFQAGTSAGDRVSFNKGVNGGGAAPKQIG